jgi:Uma2 family endonuclease
MPEEPGTRLELVRGEVRDLRPYGAQQALIVGRVGRLIDDAVEARDLGVVFLAGVGCILRRNPDSVRRPDVAFVAWEHFPGRRIPEEFCPCAPEFVIETVASDDRAIELHDKVHDFLEAGTRLFWVLWPHRRVVTIWRPDRMGHELGPDDYLDGGDVLPDFRVRVADFLGI